MFRPKRSEQSHNNTPIQDSYNGGAGTQAVVLNISQKWTLKMVTVPSNLTQNHSCGQHERIYMNASIRTIVYLQIND